jgi:colanic acid biosynthesis glycosyl transferase WcaI
VAILFLNQFYWPDTAATSQYLTDVTRSTPNITVICGSADYSSTEDSPPPPVRIIRTKPLPFSRATWARAASYASFMATALYQAFRIPTPDVVVSMTTPPLLSLIGNVLQARGARHFIWEMDVYPDIATDLGVLRPNGITDRIFRSLANWSRHRAHGIIALGDDMKSRLIAHGIASDKIHICENWADGQEITPLPFPTGPLHIHYSGNLGLAHDLPTIRDVIRILGKNAAFRFIFAGGGPQRVELEAFSRENGLHQVEFHPYSKRSNLSRSLAQSHLGLVTQKTATLGSVVPSKTYGIMAAGRPILYIGPRDATPARIIREHGCGWQIDPGDVKGLLSLLELLATRLDLIAEAGARARQAFEAHYDRPIGVARIRQVIARDSVNRDLSTAARTT